MKNRLEQWRDRTPQHRRTAVFLLLYALVSFVVAALILPGGQKDLVGWPLVGFGTILLLWATVVWIRGDRRESQ